jgi:hypothetical protein
MTDIRLVKWKNSIHSCSDHSGSVKWQTHDRSKVRIVTIFIQMTADMSNDRRINWSNDRISTILVRMTDNLSNDGQLVYRSVSQYHSDRKSVEWRTTGLQISPSVPLWQKICRMTDNWRLEKCKMWGKQLFLRQFNQSSIRFAMVMPTSKLWI